MDDPAARAHTAFQGFARLARGDLAEVAVAVRHALERDPSRPVLVFEDATGRQVDLALQGTDAQVRARHAAPPPPDEPSPPEAAPRGRGRPRLGVVPREVTLLPRHWEWLAAQPGGASVTLRRLIDEARRRTAEAERARTAREAAYRFMAALAGDLPGFEEATRALFAGERPRLEAETAAWPPDVRAYALALAVGDA